MEGNRLHGKEAAGARRSQRAAAERGYRVRIAASPARPDPVCVTGALLDHPVPAAATPGSRDPGLATTGTASRPSGAGGVPSPFPEAGEG